MSRSKLSGIECLSPFAALVKVAVDGLVALSLEGLFSNKLKFVLAHPGVYTFVGKLRIIIPVFGRRRNIPRALFLGCTWIVVRCVIFGSKALVI